MPDSLSVLSDKPLSEALTRLQTLTSEMLPTFLLGAGCSKCAGIPLTQELTTHVLNSERLHRDSKDILCKIRTQFKGSKGSHIEDYLGELIDLVSIADRRAGRGTQSKVVLDRNTEFAVEQLRTAVDEIKRAIVEIIEIQVDLKTHREFVEFVHQPVRVGVASTPRRADYLVLNYDTMVEDALALEKVPFSDGIVGGATGWWDPTTLDRDGLSARVFKLHGSIEWYQLQDDPLPRRIGTNVQLEEESRQRVLIWPATTKYREAQRDPFAQLANRAWGTLRPQRDDQRLLLICGYSFQDAHVNIEIDNAIRNSAGNLTVVAFTGESQPNGQLMKWSVDENIRDQVLIFAKNGFFHADTQIRSDRDLPWWRFENLTRMLGG